ncbi:MAG: adenosylmethionine decarboxylase [Candidatus Saccharimonadales bacterium]
MSNKIYVADEEHTEDDRHIGRHLVSDMWKCQKLADDVESLEKIILNACHVANATILGVSSHKFEPQGVTVMVLLAESHISLHSWPEYNYVAIDVFTCGKDMDPQSAIDYLENCLKPEKVETKKIIRGENYAQYN